MVIIIFLILPGPKGGMRTVVVHRADKITGPWEGKLVFQDKGVAQGGMVDTPDGRLVCISVSRLWIGRTYTLSCSYEMGEWLASNWSRWKSA